MFAPLVQYRFANSVVRSCAASDRWAWMPPPHRCGGEKARYPLPRPCQTMVTSRWPLQLPDYCCHWCLRCPPLAAGCPRTFAEIGNEDEGEELRSQGRLKVFLSLLWLLCCRHGKHHVHVSASEESPCAPYRTEWSRQEYWTYCWQFGMSRPSKHIWPLVLETPLSKQISRLNNLIFSLLLRLIFSQPVH